MSSTSRPSQPAVRRLAGGALAMLTLGACRADSVLAPSQGSQPVCETSDCALPGVPAPSASIVIAPLEDAVARILPHMMDARTRADLAPVLDALRTDLQAGRLAVARYQLALAYDALDLAGRRLGASGDAAVVLDLADISAIRLALVPASAALGIAVP